MKLNRILWGLVCFLVLVMSLLFKGNQTSAVAAAVSESNMSGHESGVMPPVLPLPGGLMSQPIHPQSVTRHYAQALPDVQAGINQLVGAVGQQVQITVDEATGTSRFVKLAGTNGLRLAQGPPIEIAESFLSQYGAVFGVQDARQQLAWQQQEIDAFGSTHLTYQQLHEGIPVWSAQLRFHFNEKSELTAVNGLFIPDIQLSTRPIWSVSQALAVAIDAAVNQLVEPAVVKTELALHQYELVIFRTNLVKGLRGQNHLAYAMEVGNGRNLRQFVYVDALTGKVLDQYNGIHGDLDRRLYDPTLIPANLQWQEGDAFPTGNSDWNNEIAGTGEVYDFFASINITNSGGITSTYFSYDSNDATMITVNDDPSISCPNANWNGTSTNYCTNVSGDDTVAHEWGHAYTEYTHGLIYAWQPGALNESYSDIWGESVDLLNGRGLDSPGDVRTVGSCVPASLEGANFIGAPTENSYRWLSGEDDPAFDNIPSGSGNAIRDMWTPACFGDPDKLTSPNYYCSPGDGGGVHTNSAVPNHAFALLVDGGTYNGVTVTGLGLAKAIYIYWQAQTIYQTPTTDFADHADALEASCADLIGQPLYQPTSANPPNPANWGIDLGDTIAAADCQQVTNVINAVELRVEPTQCYFEPMLIPDAQACGSTELTSSLFLEDFESGGGALPAGWQVADRDTAVTFEPRAWEKTGNLPGGRSGNGVYAPDPIIGDCDTDNEDGVIQLFSPAIDTSGMSNIFLSFDHYMSSEMSWDGGNLSVRINGGGWQLVPATAMVINGYNSTMSGSPLAGQAAFTGANGGSVVGSWGTTTVDLSGFAAPGDSIEIVWEFGTDECNGQDGWYVDDVRIHECGSCGNNVLDGIEVCDDGNYNNGDGCSNSCQLESGYSCTAPSAPTVIAIPEGSFESGRPNPVWTDDSPDGETILNTCNGPCGGGSASDGSWWGKFRSQSNGFYEERTLSQAITIPIGTQSINFDFQPENCVFPAAEFNFLIGWASKYRVATGDAACGAGSYTPVSIDASNYADGDIHLLAFNGLAGLSNPNRDEFHVDNVTLTVVEPSVCTLICPPPANSPVDVTVTISNTDAVLSWSLVGDADQYEVWYASNDAYFTPGGDCGAAANCSVETAASYTGLDHIGSLANNYTYVIRAASSCGSTAADLSNRTGEFDFNIQPGL